MTPDKNLFRQDDIPTIVPISTRYSYAWAELNTRIQARQNVHLAFTSFVWLALSYSINNISQFGTTNFGHWIGFLMPFASLPFSLWNAHNDITIGLLSAFCSECEQWEENKGKYFPAWHSQEQGWMHEALEIRKLSDRAFIGITLATSIPAVLSWILHYQTHIYVNFLAPLAILMALYASYYVYRNSERRSQILNKYRLNINRQGHIVFAKRSNDAWPHQAS